MPKESSSWGKRGKEMFSFPKEERERWTVHQLEMPGKKGADDPFASLHRLLGWLAFCTEPELAAFQSPGSLHQSLSLVYIPCYTSWQKCPMQFGNGVIAGRILFFGQVEASTAVSLVS